MVRSCLALAAALALTGAAVAADDSVQIRREYTDRVLMMDDTAAAHVALAKWCETNDLADRAQIHWQEAIQRDPDQKEARAALGHVRKGLEWVQGPAPSAAPGAATPTAAVAPAPAPAPQDPTFPDRRRALAKEVQSIAIHWLGTTDPVSWQEGQRRILALRDPAAAEPIARILGIGSVEMRKLACEALGGIPGDEAGRLLTRFVLADESDEVYQAAVAALAGRTDERGLRQLVNALNGSEKILKRAAYALGEMREWRAVPALIAHLKTPETRVYEAPRASAGSGAAPSGTGAYIAVGTIVTYIADIQPVVAEAAVGWKPTVGAIPVGSVLSVENPRVTIHRTIIEFRPQPVVRDALKKITGHDYEYSAQDWRRSLDQRPAEAAKPE